MSCPPRTLAPSCSGDDIWMQTISGGALDLIEPRPEDVRLGDIAEQLAKLARFNGATSVDWSVAEHCLLCAEHASPEAAPYALLHDAHEAYIGNLISPAAHAYGWWVAQFAARQGVPLEAGKAIFANALAALKHTLDRAIHTAAGLAWPPPEHIRAEVRTLDARSLLTERRDLMARPPRLWGPRVEAYPPLPTRGRLKPAKSWIAAADAFHARARELCPAWR